MKSYEGIRNLIRGKQFRAAGGTGSNLEKSIDPFKSHPFHKYIKKEMINGKMVYTYEDTKTGKHFTSEKEKPKTEKPASAGEVIKEMERYYKQEEHKEKPATEVIKEELGVKKKEPEIKNDRKALLKELSTQPEEKFWNPTKENNLNPYVYDKYKEFIATGKFPYLKDVQNYIEQDIKDLSETQKENLHTQIYNASQKHRYEMDKKNEIEMQSKGWKILSPETIKDIGENSYIKISAEKEGVMGKVSHEEIVKVVKASNGDIMLMPKRAQKKAYTLTQFYQPYQKTFFRVVDKEGKDISSEKK